MGATGSHGLWGSRGGGCALSQAPGSKGVNVFVAQGVAGEGGPALGPWLGREWGCQQGPGPDAWVPGLPSFAVTFPGSVLLAGIWASVSGVGSCRGPRRGPEHLDICWGWDRWPPHLACEPA